MFVGLLYSRGRIMSKKHSKSRRNDISELKATQQKSDDLRFQLDQQARVLDITLSHISDFAYIFNRDGRFVFVNQSLLNLWGLKLEEAVGKNFFELKYPDELAARLQQQIQTVFDTKDGLRDETAYTSQTGVGGYYEYIFRPVLDREGNVELVPAPLAISLTANKWKRTCAKARNAFAFSLNRWSIRFRNAPKNCKCVRITCCNNQTCFANFPCA